MKLHYDPETDSLYIELKPVPGVDTREVAALTNPLIFSTRVYRRDSVGFGRRFNGLCIGAGSWRGTGERRLI
jgi:Protein of unknown function (DUF2283)